MIKMTSGSKSDRLNGLKKVEKVQTVNISVESLVSFERKPALRHNA